MVLPLFLCFFEKYVTTDLESLSTSPSLSPSSSVLASPSPSSSPHHSLSTEAHKPPAKPRLSKEADFGVFVAEKSNGANMTDHDKHQLVVHHFKTSSLCTNT